MSETKEPVGLGGLPPEPLGLPGPADLRTITELLQFHGERLNALDAKVEHPMMALGPDHTSEIAQLQGQVQQLETAFVEHRNAILAHNQQIQQLAQQQRTYLLRVKAAECAIAAKGPGDQQKTTLENARLWYEFLSQPEVMVAAPQQGNSHAEPPPPPDEPTKH